VPLVLPDALWQQLLNEFARQEPGVERIAYLDGYRVEDLAVATTVVVPDATCTPGYYTVNADQMRQAGAHFRRFEMTRLAQVHTHGNDWTDHSCRDDEMAYSQRPGSLSIVLPRHATQRPEPHEGSLLVRDPDEWRPLDEEEARTALLVVPSLLDLRSSTWIASHRDMKTILQDAWNRSTQRVRSLCRSRSQKR
jgi:hypothetical protein